MRPTGRLHIGHYFGALENWVKLQNDPQYECFFFVADWHALTSDYADTSQVAQNTIEIATDWLASGLDPVKCTMFLQSSVPEHAELQLLLSMVTPLGWLERVPTYKEALENVKDKDLHTHGFLGYPILQTADIIMYGERDDDLFVPVGEDQASHVELAREIVRTFNFHAGASITDDLRRESAYWRFSEIGAALNLAYLSPSRTEYEDGPLKTLKWEAWAKVESRIRHAVLEMGVENARHRLDAAQSGDILKIETVLREPHVILTSTPRIPGTDGRKMSKSYGNFISLSDSDQSIRTKVRGMITDPDRKRRYDKGNPEVCPVYSWHKLYSSQEIIGRVYSECRTAEIGCVDCKGLMADNLIKWIEPVRARREEYSAHPGNVLKILDEGSLKAREVAKKTMMRVREAVFRWKEKRAEVFPERQDEGAATPEHTHRGGKRAISMED
jgi:tryptophanyl-tRNA synthetase